MEAKLRGTFISGTIEVPAPISIAAPELPPTPASFTPIAPDPGRPSSQQVLRVALFGNPNTGKTTLFNRLCGLRAKTANFPGITADARMGQCIPDRHGGPQFEIVDLPGVYRLSLNLPESSLCRNILDGAGLFQKPDMVLVVVDATNLPRNLVLVAELIARGLPTIVAVNMIDIAQRRGLTIDTEDMSRLIGAPVIPIMARKGIGLDRLRQAMVRLTREPFRGRGGTPLLRPNLADPVSVESWAEDVVSRIVGGEQAVGSSTDTVTERLDQAFTHPILGLLIFALVMAGLFTVIFKIATIPMDMIDTVFGTASTWVGAHLPGGALNDLLSQGVIGGVGAVVVFLPQIALLFFLISLLEDTGYLARAAFVMDRIMCRFGLPGQAFVPLLSAHACALPGIMSTKLIPDRKDRLTTILIAPFMSCSARVPIYVLITTLLFKDRPWLAGLAFFGCYVLGAVVGMFSALLFRRTILLGKSRPMVLELPTYKMPSVQTAALTTYDRSVVFLKKAGTNILLICVVLWWLGNYPKSAPLSEAQAMRNQAQQIETTAPQQAAQLVSEADARDAMNATANSFAGRIGKFIEPVFKPLGFDWQLTVGVVTSFAAREVFVSTMEVLLTGQSDDSANSAQGARIVDRIRAARRDDMKTPVFTGATSASLLVFFVLAMQCLPTLVLTCKETGSWKWGALQLFYMTGVAWVAAFITYNGLHLVGVS